MGAPEMDPSDISVTPGSGGSGSGSGSSGNGGRSVYTSLLRRRRRTSSSPTGTQLLLQLNAAADGAGSGSSSPSSSSAGPVINPEDSPAPHPVRRLVLVSPLGSPTATDDDVLIMDGVLVDDGAGTPTSARRSTPSVDSNGFRTPSSARRSVSFVDSNGPGNRRSVSMGDLVLVSSGSQGSSGGGNGDRRSGSSGQFPREESRGMQGRNRYHQMGSPNRWRPPQGAGPSNNIHRGQEPVPPFPSNINIQQRPEAHYPYNLPQPRDLPHPLNVPYFGPLLTGGPQLTTFTPPLVTIPQAPFHPTGPLISRPQGGSGFTIHNPDGSARVVVKPPPPDTRGSAPAQQPEASRATVTAPPAEEGGTSAPKQSEAPPPPPPESAPAEAQTFWWPPTSAEDSAITAALYGPSTSGRPRLPVFRDICPDDDDETSQGPPPLPTSPPPPPPPPPRRSQ